MNVDIILRTFAEQGVDAILIGGMNFLLRHKPVLTFDVDLWVKDDDKNLALVARALHVLRAEWGRDDSSWMPVPQEAGWLRTQALFCLTSPHGAIDIFREVAGLEGNYRVCRERALESRTASGIPYISLSDQDMIACQMALPAGERRLDRVAYLSSLSP